MKIVNLAYDIEETPYAFLTKGHVPFKDFFESVNPNWSEEVATQENTFYQYATVKNDRYKTHVPPDTKDCFPITIAYWEEAYPEQIEKPEGGDE